VLSNGAERFFRASQERHMNDAEFIELLHATYLKKDDELKRQFDRSLPFGDALFDRWERARRLKFGEETSIYNSALIYGEVKVGMSVWIGPYALLDGSGGGIVIGDYCSISAGVHIYTHDTVLWALSGGKLQKHASAVHIGSCVYVGSQCVITAGVRIGTRCVLAANSFVNRNVPDGTIVGGSPAEVIGRVEGEGESVRITMLSSSLKR
jgi:carbonic anhydrase/acetyltransferase-like protein (isoleucine patch superfamily)